MTGAIGNVGLILRPEAALAVATEFTFPLALAIAVLALPRRPGPGRPARPEAAGGAPTRMTDTFIRFEPEEQL